MSDYTVKKRKRKRTLLIVEGDHEKNKLFWLLFQCFPEINIEMDDVWVYGTNIYKLYEAIDTIYDPGWAERGDDIDLPYVISKGKHLKELCYKRDFINILIVFDYERHDPFFSEQKILDLQKYFTDAADMGKLYINYPMIESYQHLKRLPDEEYKERKIAGKLAVSKEAGKYYKSIVRRETVIGNLITLPDRIEKYLKANLPDRKEEERKKYLKVILRTCKCECRDDFPHLDLENEKEGKRLLTVKYWLKSLTDIPENQTYLEHMRNIFIQIVCHNICKANRIQKGEYNIAGNQYRECFENLDLTEILRIQNMLSHDEKTGFIWVLNTCVFFVAEYNFSLIEGRSAFATEES
ncbi:MAG: hypothetical protein LUD07_06645 [Clostridiales bacterium]|nr:hypothetical protein [Clostridiales bacterium]